MSKTTNEIEKLIGKLFSFNTSLKLYHWHVTGKASYAQHIAIDQALESLGKHLDRLAETEYALKGDITIVVPEAKVPTDIVAYCEKFHEEVKVHYDFFQESFSEGILDDISEAIVQLLYRLKRLQ